MSGLLSVRLLEPWNEKAAGDVVEVDPLRAAKLEETGVGEIEQPDRRHEGSGYHDFGEGTFATLHGSEAVQKAPSHPPADKMVRAAPKRKGHR